LTGQKAGDTVRYAVAAVVQRPSVSSHLARPSWLRRRTVSAVAVCVLSDRPTTESSELMIITASLVSGLLVLWYCWLGESSLYRSCASSPSLSSLGNLADLRSGCTSSLEWLAFWRHLCTVFIDLQKTFEDTSFPTVIYL